MSCAPMSGWLSWSLISISKKIKVENAENASEILHQRKRGYQQDVQKFKLTNFELESFTDLAITFWQQMFPTIEKLKRKLEENMPDFPTVSNTKLCHLVITIEFWLRN